MSDIKLDSSDAERLDSSFVLLSLIFLFMALIICQRQSDGIMPKTAIIELICAFSLSVKKKEGFSFVNIVLIAFRYPLNDFFTQ